MSYCVLRDFCFLFQTSHINSKIKPDVAFGASFAGKDVAHPVTPTCGGPCGSRADYADGFGVTT